MIQKTFVEVEDRTVARVTFTLPDTIWADHITLVGDFNDWNTRSHPFGHNGSGVWTITLDLEPRRAYQFRYLQDNRQWINDNAADACVHNIYGSDNFIVITTQTTNAILTKGLRIDENCHDRIRQDGR